MIMSYFDRSQSVTLKLLFCALFAILFTLSANQSFAGTKELKKEIIAKYGDATYRIPTGQTARFRKGDTIIYFDKKGTTYFLTNKPKYKLNEKGFPATALEPTFTYKIKKSRVRIVPFNSKNANGFCYGTRECFDTRLLSKVRVSQGDRYQLKKRKTKTTLNLLGY